MPYRALADAVVLAHLAFVLFVALGGLLVLRARALAWLHVPATLWGVLVELAGWECPLTPLESWLRTQAGQTGYTGAFIERYVEAVLYPSGLTRAGQVRLGLLALAVNLLAYARLLTRRAPIDAPMAAARPPGGGTAPSSPNRCTRR